VTSPNDVVGNASAPTAVPAIEQIDWQAVLAALDTQGWAVLPALIDGAQCDAIAGLYDNDEGLRSRVVMARHGFGRGEYRYFSYPLPPIIQALRVTLYPHLAPIANRWHERMGLAPRFPAPHREFLDRCHAAGQQRPTPLLLRYGPEDYNCLHQDLYGEHVFPFHIAVLLSEPGQDFDGGEFVLTEQRPRMQTRPAVVPLRKGDAVIFAVNNWPVQGTRGEYRVTLRHGVSKVRSGQRHTVGIIFHDAN
jgi:hypothetical protein